MDTDRRHEARHARLPHIHFPHIHFTRKELEDRPLAGEPHPDHPLHWKLYACEAIATAVLMIIGVTTNTLLSAPSWSVGAWLGQRPLLQTALCGLCFGGAGTLAAMTRFGKVSGAHLSPSVSLAFSLGGQLKPLDLTGYCCAQIVGSVAGCACVAASAVLIPGWGNFVHAGHYAATLPNPTLDPGWVVATETVVTFGLILAIYYAAAKPRLHFIAPWIGAIYFFAMNPIFAWISGDSTNFARSLGPALFDRNWTSLWIYLAGPLLGSALGVGAIKSRIFGRLHAVEARVVNFGHHGRVPRLEAPEATPQPAAEHFPSS